MQLWLTNTWKWLSLNFQQKGIWRVIYFMILSASLGFIAYAVYKNWNELKLQKWEINYIYLALSIILFPLGMLPTVAAWHKLLEALGVKKKFSTNLRIYSLSSLPRHIPGLVWYVSSRSMLYKDEEVHVGLILVATAMEVVLLAITGFFSSILLLLQGSVVLERFSALQFVIPVALLLGVGMIFSTPIFNKLSPRLVKKWNLEHTITVQRESLLVCLLWMFVAWLGGGLLLFLLVRSFIVLSWSFYPIMVGTWGMASGIGLTIGIGISGMGLREVTLGALLSLIIPPITAVIAAIAFRIVITIGEFLWVAIFAWITKSAPVEPQGRIDQE